MPLTAILLSAVVSAMFWRRASVRELFIVLASFSMLGLVSGYLTGLSRAPAVGAVLPAVLSLLGGVAAFAMGKSRESRILVGGVLFLFSLSLLIGASWGAKMREHATLHEQSEHVLMQRAYIEAEVNSFRQALGLPPLAETRAPADMR